MARVKRGVTSHRRHKKLHKLTKGYRGGRSKLVREAKSALLHAGEYALAGRKRRKRDISELIKNGSRDSPALPVCKPTALNWRN